MLNTVIFGVKLWLWLYLIISIIFFISIILYYNREKLKYHYYKFRLPERLLKVVIFYQSNQYREYYRLIPEDNNFTIEGFKYYFNDKRILKDNDFFLEERNKIKIGTKEFSFEQLGILKKRKTTTPEIHYFFNNPSPIIYDYEKKRLELSSKELQDMNDNDLFAKLLTLETERNLLIFCLVIGIINLLATIFVIAKIMGWLDKK